MASFAVCSSPVDKEGYLQKKGDLSKDVQRRWFVLKGNLLFYFQKKQDKEPLGVIVLEACSVQVSSHGRYSFEISFDGIGTRTYVLYADNDEEMQSWIKAVSHASYEYLRSIVTELQRRVTVLTSSSTKESASDMSLLHVGPPKGTVRLPARSKSEKLPSHSPDGANPLASSRSPTKVRVKKGILVDVDSDEEAPPIPPKAAKKSATLYAPSRSSPPVEQIDFIDSHKPPHSSPLVPQAPISNPHRPLSPPSTLDRTPVLQPLANRESAARPPKPLLYGVGHNGEGRQVAAVAPVDSHKSIYEMHEEFTQAMETLKNERQS